ncbi:MAG: CoA transferase, partial [Acidimicrobiaceae bacterium]|nr:CoA transferase [Acidimicrobiaceae bacterium]
MSTQQATSGPLSGVRVVELGVWIAGPAAGGIMADWGADVIKIEPPEGDPSRLFHGILGGVLPSNPVFELDNRSKRSVVFDLRSEDGMANALRLIATADVFLTNIR